MIFNTKLFISFLLVAVAGTASAVSNHLRGNGSNTLEAYSNENESLGCPPPRFFCRKLLPPPNDEINDEKLESTWPPTKLGY